MRMNSYIRHPSVAAPFIYVTPYFVNRCKKRRTKHEDGGHPVLHASLRYILAPTRRSRRSKVKAHDPIQRWDHSFHSFRYVTNCYFALKMPVLRPGVKPLFHGSNLCFFRAASCFTDQTCVSCSLIMYRAWANVLPPPKPALKPLKCRAPYWQVPRRYGCPCATGRPGDRGTKQNWRARHFRVAHV